MNDSLLVRRFQCLRDLIRDRQRFFERYRPALNSFCQRFAGNQLHYKELLFVCLF
jgi:hypothetical protein